MTPRSNPEPKIVLILDTVTAAAASALEANPLPPELGKPQQRRMQGAMAKGGYDAANHTVTMSVSSDEPIARYGGFEILSHAPGAIDTTRLQQGIPYLFNHNWDAHLGRSQGFEQQPHKLVVTNRFGTNTLAKEKEQDIADEILPDVSLGYLPVKVDITEDKNGIRTYTLSKWMPYETSSVTVPADFTVGVNRSASDTPHEVEVTFRQLDADDPDDPETDEEDDDDEDEEDERTLDGAATPSAPAVSTALPSTPTQQRTQTMDEPIVPAAPAAVTRDLAKEERDRVQGLRNLRSLRGDQYTESHLNADINSGVDVRTAGNVLAERVIQAAQTSNVPSIATNLLNGMSEGEQRQYSRAGAVRAAINQLKPGTFSGKDEGGLEREFSEQLRKDATLAGVRDLGPGILTPGVTNARFAAMEAQKRTIASGGAAGTATNFTEVIVPPIELLRARTVCMKLGARMIPGLHGTPQFTPAERCRGQQLACRRHAGFGDRSRPGLLPDEPTQAQHGQQLLPRLPRPVEPLDRQLPFGRSQCRPCAFAGLRGPRRLRYR